jgi:hypothetical protein
VGAGADDLRLETHASWIVARGWSVEGGLGAARKNQPFFTGWQVQALVGLRWDLHVNRLLGRFTNVRLIPPEGYRSFVMSQCRLLLTDSGGIQEEAAFLGKPVPVMRDATERPEGVAAGTALLTGPRASAIVEHAVRLLTDEAAYAAMASAKNPYGDGHAAAHRRAHPTALRRLRGPQS